MGAVRELDQIYKAEGRYLIAVDNIQGERKCTTTNGDDRWGGGTRVTT